MPLCRDKLIVGGIVFNFYNIVGDIVFYKHISSFPWDQRTNSDILEKSLLKPTQEGCAAL